MEQAIDRGIKLVFLFIIVFHTSCSKKRDLEWRLFEVERFDVTVEDLENNGFEKIQEDALLFEKETDDLTIMYEISFEDQKLYSKSWKMEVGSLSELVDLLNENEYYLMVPNDIDSLKIDESFCVKHHVYNRVMFGTLVQTGRTKVIVLTYFNSI